MRKFWLTWMCVDGQIFCYCCLSVMIGCIYYCTYLLLNVVLMFYVALCERVFPYTGVIMKLDDPVLFYESCSAAICIFLIHF